MRFYVTQKLILGTYAQINLMENGILLLVAEKLALKTMLLPKLADLVMESSRSGSLLFLPGTVTPSTNARCVNKRGTTSC